MKKVKFAIILVLLLSIVSFLLSYYLYTTRENEKHKRMEVEEENVVLITKNEGMTSALDTLKQKQKDLDEKVSKMIKEKKVITQKLSVSETEKKTALSKMTDLQDKLSKAKKDLSEYKVKTADIVNDFKEQNEKLLEKIETLKQQSFKQKPINSSTQSFSTDASVTTGQTTESNVQLPKVVVNPSDIKSGKVVVVNRKFNFFICNLGQQDGIQLNDQVAVYRNNLMIATATVEKVYDNLSANGIAKVKKGFSIQEGDTVKVKRS